MAYKKKPFVMSYQVKQVLYLNDPSNERWSVVLQRRIEHDVHDHDDSRLDLIESHSFSRWIPPLNKEDHDDFKVHAIYNNHNEEIWEKILTFTQ